LLIRQLEVGLCGGHLSLSLSNLFRARAVGQAQRRLLLNLDLRTGLIGLQCEGPGIQRGQHLPCLHTVAFLDIHRQYALAAFESKRHLSNIHVAIQGDECAGGRGPKPEEQCDAYGNDNSNKDDTCFFHIP